MVSFTTHKYIFIIPLDIYIVRELEVVKSYELYLLLGLRKEHYSRWILETIPRGKLGEDYFPTEDNARGMTKIFRRRFYLKKDFASGICLRVGTKESLVVRDFLNNAK